MFAAAANLVTDEFSCQKDQFNHHKFDCQSNEFNCQSDKFNSQSDEFNSQSDEFNCQSDEFNHFSLLKSSISCIHGSRSSSGHPALLIPADLKLAESRVSSVPPSRVPSFLCSILCSVGVCFLVSIGVGYRRNLFNRSS